MPRKAKETEAPEETAELIRYELGYHLVPLISEEALPTEVGRIRETIEQAGGSTTADQFPVARPLSYEISRQIGGKRESFTQSYFGWMQFELPASAIEGVKLSLDTNDRIIRLLIVRAKREVPLTSRIVSIVQPTEEVLGGDGELVAVAAEPVSTLSDEEIDKTIEEMVID
jgi:ribosomal protein S6